MSKGGIAFFDLQRQRAYIGASLDAAITRVLQHGAFILGPEVADFERRLAAFCGAPDVVSCANGTDALVLALRILGVGPEDAVFVPAFTFAATAEAVALSGATPVFVDVRPDTFNIDADLLSEAITWAVEESHLRPMGVIAVDLFGQPADYPAIAAATRDRGLFVVADAAQGFGATQQGRAVGTLAPLTTTSFFPAKPLGCYGDGGAIFTDDPDQADSLRSLRAHGKGAEKYDNVHIGYNSRLDTLQAAILIEKLVIFPDEVLARQRIAARYDEALRDIVTTPFVLPGTTSTYAQYTVVLPDATSRADVRAALASQGVPTQVYYPKPLHQQTAYRNFPAPCPLAVSERLSRCVLSLPMHAYLSEADQDRVTSALRQVLA
jgi:dTDP-4-amino-4,6-dideoxygalactose transaminase